MQPFHLLNLPDELWARIGRIAVENELHAISSSHDDDFTASTTIVHSQDGSSCNCKVNYAAVSRLTATRPAITQTCSVLRAELLPYFDGIRCNTRCNTTIEICHLLPLNRLTEYLTQLKRFVSHLNSEERRSLKPFRVTMRLNSEAWDLADNIKRTKRTLEVNGRIVSITRKTVAHGDCWVCELKLT